MIYSRNKFHTMKALILKSDFAGAFFSFLCLLHCILTPIIFISGCTAAAVSTGHLLWGSIDYVFIIISLIAAYFSSKKTSSNYIFYALWICWAILSFYLINEKIHLLELNEITLYISASYLAILHSYNLIKS